jgi:flagellar export protein FliJ
MSVFRFERLRRLRKIHEKKRRQDMAKIIQEKEAKLSALQLCKEDQYQIRQKFHDELQHGMKASRWSMMLSFIDHYKRDEGRLRASIEQMAPALKKARESLMEASRQTQVMDRLKENWQERMTQETDRLERRVLDEIGLREAWQREHGLDRDQRSGNHA